MAARLWGVSLQSLILPLILAGASIEPAAEVQDSRELPNLVVILADDLGWGDPGCYGTGSVVPTPSLDRVAREGLRFTDMHSPSAVCTPTRYGLLTGRYAWRTRLEKGVLDGHSANLIDVDRTTLADLLRSAGYRTAGVGKWHLGLGEEGVPWEPPIRPGPLDHGFDSFFGIPASLDMPPYVWIVDDELRLAASAKVAASEHRRRGGGGFWRAGAASPDFRHVEVLPRMAARAEELIERWGREEARRPFFLYVALSAPHTPWVPTVAFQGRTRAGHYGDFVAQVDHVVGQILAALERSDAAERTLVVVTSDNGAHWPVADVERHGYDANGGWRGQKADVFEGGHRVPFLVRGPGVPAGEVRTELACLTDLFATAAAICGSELEEEAGEDSFDLSPLLFGGEGAFAREDCVHHSFDGMLAIRRGPWKLIEGRGSGGFTAPRRELVAEAEPTGQLYHLGEDPQETTDLWRERPEVVAELRELLENRRSSGCSRPR